MRQIPEEVQRLISNPPIRVKGHRILVKPDEPEDMSKGGIALVRDRQKEQLATTRGYVIAVGKTAWRSFDGDSDQWEPWCIPGDKVYFPKYAGKFIENPFNSKEVYTILIDEDILGVINVDFEDLDKEE